MLMEVSKLFFYFSIHSHVGIVSLSDRQHELKLESNLKFRLHVVNWFFVSALFSCTGWAKRGSTKVNHTYLWTKSGIKHSLHPMRLYNKKELTWFLLDWRLRKLIIMPLKKQEFYILDLVSFSLHPFLVFAHSSLIGLSNGFNFFC